MLARVAPSSPEASRRLSLVRQKGTSAELEIRRALHARGMRYCLHQALLQKPRRVADICFSRVQVAVFVDGCFWHGCPLHASWPKSNAEFSRQKIEDNRARDRDTDSRLKAEGCLVIRVWEHEDPDGAAERIAAMVRARKKHGAESWL